MNVLLVEDDKAIADSLRKGLERYGFGVKWVETAAAALAADTPDVILLDLGLPDGDGLDVCRALRERSDTPIIVISARDTETDRVVGLELGADDYVSKPFGVREVIARMRAVMRRVRPDSAHTGPETVTGPVAVAKPMTSLPDAVGSVDDQPPHPGLRIDGRARRAWVGNNEITLTAKEFDLLAYLAAEPGVAFTREAIMGAVWDQNWFGPTKTLDVHVRAIRQKIVGGAVIETLRGVGYRLVIA